MLFLVNASGQRHRLFSLPCSDRTALFCTSAHITGDSSTESPPGEFPERNNQISQSLSLVFLLILQLGAITPALQTVSDFSPTIWKRLPVHPCPQPALPVSRLPSSPRLLSLSLGLSDFGLCNAHSEATGVFFLGGRGSFTI